MSNKSLLLMKIANIQKELHDIQLLVANMPTFERSENDHPPQTPRIIASPTVEMTKPKCYDNAWKMSAKDRCRQIEEEDGRYIVKNSI